MSGVALILIAKLVAAGVCFYLGKVLLAFPHRTGNSAYCSLASLLMCTECRLRGWQLTFPSNNLCLLSCVRVLQFMFADWVNSMLKENATFKTLKKKTGSSGFMLVLGLRLSPVPSYLCSYCASASANPHRVCS
jgi:hypothetical protein